MTGFDFWKNPFYALWQVLPVLGLLSFVMLIIDFVWAPSEPFFFYLNILLSVHQNLID
jgi:hypothetical protein